MTNSGGCRIGSETNLTPVLPSAGESGGSRGMLLAFLLNAVVLNIGSEVKYVVEMALEKVPCP